MKLKLDENLRETLIAPLSALGFDVDSVRSEGLEGRPDPEIWKGTQQDGRMLLTQDLDFGDARKFAPGSHYGCVIFRLGNPGLFALTARVLDVMGMPEANT